VGDPKGKRGGSGGRIKTRKEDTPLPRLNRFQLHEPGGGGGNMSGNWILKSERRKRGLKEIWVESSVLRKI